jgi:hypothetical protein
VMRGIVAMNKMTTAAMTIKVVVMISTSIRRKTVFTNSTSWSLNVFFRLSLK